jgi:YegS/Rv2252/BmrU family lipid kinase
VSARTLVIVNPRSRNGATGRRWKKLEVGVRRALGPLEVEYTLKPRDAERIAREGVRAGVERVVVAGGDGTVSEVVTGLLAADLGDYAQLGVLPLGTGGDFARSLGIPRRMDDAIGILASGFSRRIDAGRITYRDASGREARAYFINVASFGISGLTDQLVNEAPKGLGGAVSFMVGAVRAIARYRGAPVVLRVDGVVAHEGPVSLATAANGSWFGGGMRVAPDARIDDGWLDVVIVPHLPKHRLLAKLPLIYSGKHVSAPEVRALRGRVVEADAEVGSVLLDVDGEAMGSLPARLEVLPAAIEVVGASG